MSEKGQLIVISGFAGVGKGSVVQELMSRYPDQYCLSVSATTREKRPGETEGVSYFYVTEKKFEEMVEEGEFLEFASYVGHHYGSPRKYIQNRMEEGKNVILEIDLQGALQIKANFPQAILIFIAPPSAAELKKRLINRGTETMDVVEKRLSRAREEANGIESYDYVLVNENIKDCAETIHMLIYMNSMRTCEQLEFIHRIREDIQKSFQ